VLHLIDFQYFTEAVPEKTPSGNKHKEPDLATTCWYIFFCEILTP